MTPEQKTTKSPWILKTARPFTFRANLLNKRRRDEIRQQHRRYNHRPDDGFRSIKPSNAMSPVILNPERHDRTFLY